MNLFGSMRANIAALLAIVVSGYLASPVQAQINAMTDNGWHTWRVPAVSAAPEICCFSWSGGNVTRRGCDLDGRHGGFSTRSDGDAAL